MDQQDKREIINKWLSDNYNQLEINRDKTAQYNNPLKDDLLALTLQQFLEMGIDRCYEIVTEGKPENYITRAMSLNLKSDTSIFYQQYRKPALRIREWIDNNKDTSAYEFDFAKEIDGETATIDEKIARKVLQNMDVYERTLFEKLYLQGWTQPEVAEHYGLDHNSVKNNVTAARGRFLREFKKIKKQLN